MECLIIIDKLQKMIPCYQTFYNFQPPYLGIQNLYPFISYNYFPNFVQAPMTETVKQQQQASINPINISYECVPVGNAQSQAYDFNIRIPSQFQNPQQYREILNEEQLNPLKSASQRKTKLIFKSKQKENKRNTRGQKKDKAYVAKQYPKQEPSINCRYIQKNFELNIINQVFSFLWSEQKSGKFTKKFFKGDSIKITLFYEYIKIIRKFCRRYINKEYLKNLCDYQNSHIAYKMVVKNTQKLQYLPMDEFSKCVRHLIFIYLHQLCPQAILTSKKMRKQIWGEHLIKCRLLRNFMFYQLSSDQYQKLLIHSNATEDRNKLIESTSGDNSQRDSE